MTPCIERDALGVSCDSCSQRDSEILVSSILCLSFMRTGSEKVQQNKEIEVMMGRTARIPVASKVAARFGFEELCGKALGAADYLAIVRSHHVIFIDRCVVMKPRLERVRGVKI